MSTKSATKSVAKKATKTESTPVVQETKTASRRSRKEESRQVEPEPEVQEESEPKQRRVVTRDSVESDFNSVLEDIKNEIMSIRTSTDKKKSTGRKFLSHIGKRLKQLRSDTLRVAKQRKSSNRAKNTTSGFMKAVPISRDMAKFCNWDASQQRSRVEVTKYLCNYIKENNLQNPDKRTEINPDERLANLLGIKLDAKTKRAAAGQPTLTYPGLQKRIQSHFNKSE
jgi:chromatin remodeling complex protein RSC6